MGLLRTWARGAWKGESLFNDGIRVVLFVALVSAAAQGSAAAMQGIVALNASGLLEVFGGIALVPVLTWSRQRGGISIAMALSLMPVAARDLVLART